MSAQITRGEDPSASPESRLARSPNSWRARLGRIGTAIGRARPLFNRRFTALYIALAVNALLAAGFIWSTGGASTHIRIEAVNGTYRAFVDGKQQIEARCQEYSAGGVLLRVYSESPAAALPSPSGLDRLVVTDADSGEILYSAKSPDFAWTIGGDRWKALAIGDNSWRNYYVDAYFSNVAQGSIAVHSADASNGIFYSFRPFRHLDNGLDYVANGKTAKCPAGLTAGPTGIDPVGTVSAPGLELSKVQTFKSMVAMTLRPYPYILVTAWAILALVVLLQLAGLERRVKWLLARGNGVAAGMFVVPLVAATFGMLFYISHNVNQAMPHVPDEVSYLFQAKILASFQVTTPVPPVKDAFSFFYPSLLTEAHGHWSSIYPFGHPLMLALGELMGAAWIIPPIIGALCVLLIFAVGRRMHGAQVGLIAAILLAFSPFFQMTASNFMSHNTAVFYILASLFFVTAGWKRRSLAYGLGGICFGLVLNTRPLTAVALVPPFGLLFASDLWLYKGERIAVIRRSLAFAFGVLLMVGAFYLYNRATTGSFGVGYGTNSGLETVVGFGEKNSVARGMQNEQADLASLLIVLHGWPLIAGLALVLLPFMLGTRSRWDVFLLFAAVCAIGVWTAYEGSGLMHGPRYWYEAIPFLMLLAARGVVMLQQRVSQWASAIVGRGDERPVALSGIACYGFLVVLLGMSVHGWVLGKHYETPKNDYAPRSISELKGFNNVSDRLLRAIEEADLHNALVIVRPCSNWQCYGTVFWKNDINFDGDVVYARDVRGLRSGIAAFLDRKIYLADYGTGSIVPYDPFPIRLDSPGA